MKKIWTYEKCYEVALKCKSRGEMHDKYGGAYSAALKNGWLKDYTWFEELQKPKDYWNYDTCYAAASECEYAVDFKNKYPVACTKAYENGWVKDYTWFKSPQKPNGYWQDYDRCMECALKCKNASEFAKKYPGACNAARDNGWIKDYPWYKGKKESGYWDDYDHCFEEARKYNSRREFMLGNHSAYNAARRHGWLDDYDWFEKKNNIYTDNVYVVYAYEFKEYNSVYVGLTCHMNIRDNEHRNGKKKTGVRKFADKNNCEIPEQILLEDKLNPEEAQDYEAKWVEHYNELGFNLINKAKCGKGCGALGSVVRKWSYEKCKALAKQCNSRIEFEKLSKSAYEASRKKGWLDEFFPIKKAA